MNRLKASSPSDYIKKLLARRTSKNGVFGMKAHFHHFDAFRKDYPELLEVLSPLTYIFISREDRVAQAVSMAKALQTDWWTSRMEEGPKPVLRYDREMIASCIEEIERQDLNWRRWFDAHNVTPFLVTYNQLIEDPAKIVKRVVELLGVQDDEPDEVNVPPARKQADETNTEWTERFQRETQGREELSKTSLSGQVDEISGKVTSLSHSSVQSHFFDRYNGLIKTIPSGAASATGFLDLIRLRRRYNAIVAEHRDLFRNARVLDIMSSFGFWSLAVLDAGAGHVVGIDTSQEHVASANKTFEDYDIDRNLYGFLKSQTFAALRSFEPGSFDLILCQESFERSDPHQLFYLLKRLRPKHVIVDTDVVRGEGPILRFSAALDSILGTPNHSLIMFLCDAFGFRWRLLDWRSISRGDWTGIHDYERDLRRTYILEVID
jgi:LPS sulfotransferase NodH